MPRHWVRGPQGQVRPTEPEACARMVMEIATGQRVEHVEKPDLPGPESPPTGRMYGPGLPFRHGRTRWRWRGGGGDSP